MTGGSDRPAGLTVVFAGTPYGGMPMSEWHVAKQLARTRPVLWVDPPCSITRALRIRRSGGEQRLGVQRIDENITRLTPLTPPGTTRPVLRSATRLVTRSAARRAARDLGGTVTSVVAASMDDVLDVWPGARKVLYLTDDFLAGAALMGVSPEYARRTLRCQLAKADVVVAVSDVLAGSLRNDLGQTEVVVVPNGCDVDLLSAPAQVAADVDLPRPVAGFVGHVSDRIDLACLESVADAGLSLLLVGPCLPTSEPDRFAALLRRPNVLAVGRRAFDDMPAYFAGMDVGLTPYTLSDFNQASFPLKTLDYLAAGLPVVSTDLAGSRSLATDQVRITAPARFGETALQMVSVAGGPELVRERQEVARAHSWDRRADQIAALLDRVPAAAA